MTSTKNEKPNIHNLFVVPDCQIQWVTVFQDKAEVCRSVRPRVTAGEGTEILFKQLSPTIDKDSIRMEVKGSAVIHDVKYCVRHLDTEEANHLSAVNELRGKLRQEKRHREALFVKQQRLEKQRQVLSSFADSLIGSGVSSGLGSDLHSMPQTTAASYSGAKVNNSSGGSLDSCDPKSMEIVREFFTLYESRADIIDEGILACREDLELTDANIREMEKSIKNIELHYDENLTRELVVLVESIQSGSIELLLTYVVHNACWTPSYDIRIFNNDGNLKIVYYGVVQQATGEDWDTPQLRLSTSQPAIGGTVPEMGMQMMQFKSSLLSNQSDKLTPLLAKSKSANLQNAPSSSGKKEKTNRISMLLSQNAVQDEINQATLATRCISPTELNVKTTNLGNSNTTLVRSRNALDEDSANYQHESVASPTLRNSVLRAQSMSYITGHKLVGTDLAESHLPVVNPNSNCSVSIEHLLANANIPSAGLQFEIPRPPNQILCDSEPIRVSIGIIDLEPSFEFVSIPKKAPYAYLKANMVNTSKFPLFPGPTNIYVDNNFVAKSTLGAVAPLEEFSCKLGADMGIKVTYNPMYKYKEVSMSSGKNIIYTFKQTIEIKNSHERSVKILVMDQLPASKDDKIRVTLHEPNIKHPEKYDKSKHIRLNKLNNIEWDLELAPNESQELTLKYSIEHPASEEVVFYDN